MYKRQVQSLRVPMQYLANLLAGGNTKPVIEALSRLLAERTILRKYSDEAGTSQFLTCEILPEQLQDIEEVNELKALGLTVQDICDMHRLLAIADFKDRFVVPSANRNTEAAVLLQGTQGYNLGGGENMRRRADSLFGGPMNRKIIPLFEEYQRAPDSTQEGK